MKISCTQQEQGLKLEINNKEYEIIFPKEVWDSYPYELKKIHQDNYAYLKTLHLPQLLNNGNYLNLNTDTPLFKDQIYRAMMNHIPFCADIDGQSTSMNLKKFMNLEHNFSSYNINVPKYGLELKEKAVISMSFGKDSLLTYAIAKEIGLDPELVMSLDDDCPLENKYKIKLADQFSRQFNVKIWRIENNAAKIHRYAYWGLPKTEWGFGHLITEYMFNMIPFAHHLRARYIFFGNESSCNDYYVNQEGYVSYPVFDQTSNWMVEMDKMAKVMTSNNMNVASLIEPLNDLFIMDMLHKKYPEIGKYQMSCFSDDSEFGHTNRWCGHCSKCARIYIFLLANGIDPKSIGFIDDMLKKEYLPFYSLFGIRKKKDESMAWDISGLGREEQMYAFLLAYKRGIKGDIIDEFKRYFLNEALRKEDKLFDKYFGLDEVKTIPDILLKKIFQIYKKSIEDV